MKKALQEYYAGFDSVSQYDRFCFSKAVRGLSSDVDIRRSQVDRLLETHRADYLSLESMRRENRQQVGFKVRRYRSGEMTGAQFSTGSRCKVVPPSRSGAVVTDGFTLAGRLKIRRAVENAFQPLQRFVTLTFDPAKLYATTSHADIENALSGYSSDYHLGHKYAKKELMRWLDTTGRAYKRRGQQFSYVWVAELQPSTGFIHFHIMTNLWIPKDWIRKIWGQGRTRIDYIKNTRHAVNYMRKYITKDESSPIQGNRYNISADLRETMKPEEIIEAVDVEDLSEGADNPGLEAMEIINAMREEITNRGGIVLDFGFSLPAPRRPEKYRDKKSGEIKQTRGISRTLAPQVLSMLQREETALMPF